MWGLIGAIKFALPAIYPLLSKNNSWYLKYPHPRLLIANDGSRGPNQKQKVDKGWGFLKQFIKELFSKNNFGNCCC